jgi:putative MATE family efflux protein
MKDQTSSPKKGIALSKDWTKGSIIQNILLLSWPMIILGVLYTVNLVLELIWVGKLGSAAIAGVGVGGIVVMLVGTVKTGFDTGQRATVARFVGGGDIAAANHFTGQAFIISFAYCIVIALIGILFSDQIFNLFGLEPNARADGVLYLRIVMIGYISEAFWVTAFTAMQASGDTITPMKIAVFIRVVNLILCPFLVLGLWIFPRLGVAGAAVTFITVSALGAVICLWALFTGQTRLRLKLSDFNPDMNAIWRILKIAMPASGMGLAKSFGDLILVTFMVPFGNMALAAHNLIYRIENFVNSPAIALGMGASVLVGQNLGANQPKQASRSGWLTTLMIAGFIVVCSIVLLIWTEQIVGLFTSEPELIALGSTFVRIAVAGYLGMGVVNVMQNCISGAGDTLPPMLVTLGMIWIVQMPLAFLLSRYTDLGMYGVRWAIVIGFIVGAICYIAYFWAGRWKHKKV